MTPFQTAIRFRMKSCILYLFYFSNLHVLLKRSLRKFEPCSVRICAGVQNFSTMFNTNSFATVSASCWGVGSATRNLLSIIPSCNNFFICSSTSIFCVSGNLQSLVFIGSVPCLTLIECRAAPVLLNLSPDKQNMSW